MWLQFKSAAGLESQGRQQLPGGCFLVSRSSPLQPFLCLPGSGELYFRWRWERQAPGDSPVPVPAPCPHLPQGAPGTCSLLFPQDLPCLAGLAAS